MINIVFVFLSLPYTVLYCSIKQLTYINNEFKQQGQNHKKQVQRKLNQILTVFKDLRSVQNIHKRFIVKDKVNSPV